MEPWKERQRAWLVQSLNDRKQRTSGCWEWVRERFVFLIGFFFLISSNMGTGEGGGASDCHNKTSRTTWLFIVNMM